MSLKFILHFAVSVAAGSQCDASSEDDYALLQARTTKVRSVARASECPGSGNACDGNQCCPGYEGSDGKTFPCPNADEGWNECEGSLEPVFNDTGACCFSEGCTSCNSPNDHFCNVQDKCEGTCAGTWCPGGGPSPPPAPEPIFAVCCYSEGCTSCNDPSDHFCNMQDKCDGVCGGTWCPEGPGVAPTPAPQKGSCCYSEGCNSCNSDEEHYCNLQENCEGTCAGTWCPEGLSVDNTTGTKTSPVAPTVGLPAVSTKAAQKGSCCYSEGCNSCNGDEEHYCNLQENCEGTCAGTWCPEGLSVDNTTITPSTVAPSTTTTSAPAVGVCCYMDGCNGCNPVGHYCSSEDNCGGSCAGTWCPQGPGNA